MTSSATLRGLARTHNGRLAPRAVAVLVAGHENSFTPRKLRYDIAFGASGVLLVRETPWDTAKATDQVLFDDILAYVKDNLCIDTTRVFATGFSYGGMMTYSLSATRQKDIRAAVGIAPANYNIYVGTKTHQPIAWMQTTGMDDCTCPWVQGQSVCGGTPSTTNGSKFIAIEHGTDNGCTIPNPIPTWTSGAHVCTDFTGCKDGYPTKVCTFNGGHTNINSDPGSSANWIPQESWKFFTQF
jgi:poly(3-hydroxybutyrate) depolymerase